jgi:Mg2+-importing ATPase
MSTKAAAISFWATPLPELLQQLGASSEGLASEEAHQRLIRFGANHLRRKSRVREVVLLLSQFKSPIVLILLTASSLSVFLGNPTDAVIILAIVLVSGLLGYWQERGAGHAVERLLAVVRVTAEVVRDGTAREIAIEDIVPGDMLLLSAGAGVPGDARLLESKDLFVDEATLTGETYPIEKAVGVFAPDTPLNQRANCVWMGTHVISGSARAVVVRTGKGTQFGGIAQRLTLRPPETEFERGVRLFGYLLLEVTLVLVIAIFAINVALARPVLDAFLFSMALAVGLTPQLLPAIISINLAHGAKRMARRKVIVKRLAAIENFGSMNVLCCDKTGTLTEGVVRLHSAIDVEGKESERVLFHAYLNAVFESGFLNPIDEAIRRHRPFDVSGYRKLDEEPYDFVRKRLSVLIGHGDRRIMVTKGALSSVLSVCSSVESAGGSPLRMDAMRAGLLQRFADLSGSGFRVIGLASRDIAGESKITRTHECDMTFLGFLVLYDPPKAGISETLASLKGLGVSFKLVTGDHHLVAAHLSDQIGLPKSGVVTGAGLRRMSDEALLAQVNQVQVFAEVEPNQKERIILALKKAGNVVGYSGDGINDASALHAADVGISVDSAVDVAKEAADIVLLDKDLGVLVDGVREGRVTFANTLKYVFMATSANFGNMFSMAGASLFLPFLPLLPKQILLTNFLTDIPEMTIATDRVDDELIQRPRRWDIGFIKKFMLTFGLVSSVFDYLTFAALLFVLDAGMEQFRTGWFVESVISAAMIVLVIRTRRPFFHSRPAKGLFFATAGIVAVTLALPFTPVGRVFGLAPLPISFLAMLIAIVALYMVGAEGVKKMFYARLSSTP